MIVCNTWAKLDEAERRVKMIFKRLKLQLHPDKTRKVELRDGKQGFDFLGCHLHKRMSGRIWENERKRVYFLQRWPSTTSVKRVKQRVKELAPNTACHRDLRDTIAKINRCYVAGEVTSQPAMPRPNSTRSTATSGLGYAN